MKLSSLNPFRRREPEQVRTLTLEDVFGTLPATSSIAVGPDTAMRCAARRACILAISEKMGSLPVEAGGYQRLIDRPNGWTTRQTMMEKLVRDALLWGNGYLSIVRNSQQRPIELIRLRNEVTLTENTTREPEYRIGGKAVSGKDLIHIQAPGIGIGGDSPVTQGREAIGVCLALERHAARLFGKGAKPSGLLKFPHVLGDDVAARIKASWQAAHGGADNSGGTAVLEEGAEFQPITFNSVDSQFVQIWRHSLTEVARVFRVPPHLIFELNRATWSNAATMGSTFLRFTLRRWIEAVEGEFALKGIPVRINFDSLLRSDLNERAGAYSTMIAARILSPNEAREMEGLEPYPGGDRFENPNTTSNTGSENDEDEDD